jgi:hypothetical protein
MKRNLHTAGAAAADTAVACAIVTIERPRKEVAVGCEDVSTKPKHLFTTVCIPLRMPKKTKRVDGEGYHLVINSSSECFGYTFALSVCPAYHIFVLSECFGYNIFVVSECFGYIFVVSEYFGYIFVVSECFGYHILALSECFGYNIFVMSECFGYNIFVVS